jgi:hypothetical protein
MRGVKQLDYSIDDTFVSTALEEVFRFYRLPVWLDGEKL